MRMTAPAVSAALLVLAAAFVWYFRPEPESDAGAVILQPESAVSAPTARETDTQTLTANAPTPAAVPVAAAAPAPDARRSPLPGETATTPMANLQVGLGREPRPGVAEGERDFAAEPIDWTWAPDAEADLLARFAQMPGLTLTSLQVHCRSTMCRLEVVQPGSAPSLEGRPRRFSILRDSVGLEPRWMMQVGDSSNEMRSVAYLWREGFAPKPPPGPANETN